ncbi:ATP-binding protein [Sphingomonas oligophenolica]|uniref:ATP-binding protein n=1 Tax=Sphingomonas oligophenolica TaxID=301154 RepID=UPI001386B744|nr:ATP-binding protein [Sphingomonas oligophenolica]
MLLIWASPAFAQRTKNFDELVAEAKSAMQTNPRIAITKAAAAEYLATQKPRADERDIMIATAQWLTGEALLRLDEEDRAIPLLAQALKVAAARRPGSVLEADLLLATGGVATERGEVAKALLDYQAAHRIYRARAQTRSQAKALIQIAILYYGANDWVSALRYYREALDAYAVDPGLALSIHNGRGNALTELRRFKEARAEFTEAIRLARQMNSPLLTATVLNNAARLDLRIGDLVNADLALSASFRETGNDAPSEFRKQQLALAAQAAFQHRSYSRAEGLIAQSFEGADFAKTTLADRDAHETAFRTYRALHREDLALVHLQALKRLDDDATDLARSTSAALMGARFDFANQALKIANLKAEDAQKTVAIERTRASTQREIFLGAATATIILILMLLYALRTSRRARETVQVANDDLAVTNSALGKALAAKTEFLATTSHEIRTPLNGILGMTQVMLVDRSLDAATRDRLSVVQEAGVAMKALVDDILDVAKMETGNLTIEHNPFDLKATILAASGLWETQARAKGLGFERNLDACPTMVCGDAARVRQILFNLLSNAIKFTADGRIGLTVGRGADGRCRFEVTDTGIGIAPDKIDAIFESFRQADTSTTRHFGGTGLGLTISRNLARAMGGEVSARSVVGEGTSFAVDIPLPDAAAVPVIAGGSDSDTIDLVIVDRNPIARSMLKTILAPHHPCVVAVGSIDEAMVVAQRARIARLLVDGAGMEPDVLTIRLKALATATGATIALLWPAADESALSGLDVIDSQAVILKPIAGNALVQRITTLGAPAARTPLVSEAA